VIYRVVLAVVLASALVAVVLPPMDDARREWAATFFTVQVDSIERTADALIATDEPTDGIGARRVVTLRLPARHLTNAGVECVTFAPVAAGDYGRVSWRVHGGRTSSRSLSVPLATTDDEPLVLDEPGHHRLVLALAGRPGAPVVVVRQLK
jgi:hypothetical protein